MTHGRIAYLVYAGLLTGVYGLGEVRGWEPGRAARDTIAPAVRQSPGGWRSFTFWHQGLSGGK